MKKQEPHICKSLSDSKTYILVVEDEEQSISESAIDSMKAINGVHVDIVEKASKKTIPNHDVYVMSTKGLSYAQKLKLIKTIYRSNSRAALFLVGDDTPIVVNKINEDINGLLHPTKMGEAIQGTINPQETNFSEILEYIHSLEDTKKRLNDLWLKLEEVDSKLC